MIDKNLILYLPFDDPDGSVAYDYSKSRADGTLSGGAFFSKQAKVAKCLDLNGDGECVTSRTIPFSSSFTLCFYVKPTTNSIGWLLNLPGVDNFLEQWLEVMPDIWYFMAFVKNGNQLTVYKDGNEIYKTNLKATPVGLSINDPNLSGVHACFDEVQLFDVVKTPVEILKMQSDTDVEYYIDGKNFKDFGVYVSASSGLVGLLERKDALTVDWDNYHGKVVDKKRPRYKERTITLECFIEASNKSAFVEWVNLFMAQFDKEGDARLKVEYDGKAKPLVYEVYCPDAVDVTKKWSDDLMVGTFKIKLVECEPVKKVLRHIGVSANSKAQINVTSSKLLNIYWGDGTHTFDVSGETTVEHTYTDPDIYDIIVTGVIEDIEAFNTNCIIVWDRLL
ncbi:hypothetical protein PO081_16880 [Bacteroides thetaiotaomicron]|uniref:hypothetical protein n=1 Tax=Bacteroides thetaiotaomicron TaxID=818 RepID=UPI00232AC739|nr:hypothetical protein [Bacteroides thetaiotaomicron]MDC2194957.1 hypothetical protein [Bacteroides thetaiotaomicron]